MIERFAAVLLAVAAAGDVTDRQRHTFVLSPGRTLSVEVTVGDVRIEGSRRPDALVEIARTAPTREGLDRVPLVVHDTPQAVRISAVQSDGGTDPAYRADVTVQVPWEASLPSVRVLEGRLTLSDLRGTIAADVRRGPIDAVGLQGTVRLETGMGDVVATRMRLVPGGVLRLRAFNGDVRVALAERPRDARIMALALNGSIESEIPLAIRDTWGPRWAEATLGAGEPVLSIDVITGRIVISAPAAR